MINVKDLMNNKELMKNIVEDLEDFPEGSPVTYEVWALGYDRFDSITDAELLLAEFEDPDKAVTYAKQVTLADIIYKASGEDIAVEPATSIAYISVEVETVLQDPDDEFVGGTINVGTIYKKEFNLCEDEPAEPVEETINLSTDDYTLLDDGTLEVRRAPFSNNKKNDIVKVMFVDEDNKPILTYKIISEIGNLFICEFAG